MKRLAHIPIAFLALSIAIPAFGDDQQKAEKQLHKIVAMATDATGRRVVSIVVADTLQARRPELVIERRSMNLNYGDLFVAYVLVKQGTKLDDVATQMKAGKKIAADAKKLNAQMEDHLYKHFLNGKVDAERDVADGYDPMIDGVAADNDVSKEDIADAEHTYQTWRDRAEKAKDSKLDASTEKAAQGARGDPVKAKGDAMTPPK